MSLRTFFDKALLRADAWPFSRAFAGGTVAGLVLGAALLLGGGTWGLLGVAVVGAILGWVGWTAGVGVFVEEPPDLLDMVDVPGGTFLMGSPEDEPGRYNDERQHEVTVSAFRLARTVVTKATYREVMGIDEAPGPGVDDHPVTNVSWRDAVRFCNHLSKEAGLKPCYRVFWPFVWWVRDTGYRLPTEAEWEYAARAGTTTRWSFGDDEAQLGEHAWYDDNSDGSAHPVATREPNPWGLHDMHGNVWEWCWDVFGDYLAESVTDPRGPKRRTSAFRVVRGGSYWDEAGFVRSAYRYRSGPSVRNVSQGFRCVRGPRRQP